VVLGENNVIGPGVVLGGSVSIGSGNWIGPSAVVGAPPEVRGYSHPADWVDEAGQFGVIIGNNNVIREHAAIFAGSRITTTVGSDCFLMTGTYVGHDARVADWVTMSMHSVLAGHVQVGWKANLGIGACVHQFRVVGPGTMIGMGAVVTKDVEPFAKCYGNPARIHGANTVGLVRAGFSDELAQELDQYYCADRSGQGPPPGGRDLADHFTWFADALARVG
jgi:UDP-N-acetylglucosamine acyltransferase